ncbi:MAG: nicotinate-nucleotide--dimethylbenzimidazole phosphoribosyltransferase [Planctomycetota bacterium]
MSLIEETVKIIRPLDEAAMAGARQRLDSLTKPPGSLGDLEAMAVRLAGISGKPLPKVDRKVIYTLAADHGIAAEGVSAYPQEVTAQMVLNFLAGGAAINVLGRAAGSRIVVADVGVASELPEHPYLVSCKVAKGTRNFLREDAMTASQARQAVEAGIALCTEVDLAATGEMGIANTTSASAITALLTGHKPEEVTGCGTGISEVGRQKKADVIRRALEARRVNPDDAWDVLAKVGGFEIGGLVGVILGSAARHTAVLVDGFISGAAALLAVRLHPPVREYLFAAHQSAEPGHVMTLAALDLKPIFRLDMRLGEGTGAALAMPVMDAACRILHEMATFGEAGVSGPS